MHYGLPVTYHSYYHQNKKMIGLHFHIFHLYDHVDENDTEAFEKVQ